MSVENANATCTTGYAKVCFPMAIGERQDRMSLSTGAFVVQWPAALANEDVADIEEFLTIVLRKIKRTRTPRSDEVAQ